MLVLQSNHLYLSSSQTLPNKWIIFSSLFFIQDILSLSISLLISICISLIILEFMRLSMPLQTLSDLPNRDTCTCSCFDNRFKQGNPSLGPYLHYKSFYFNFDERISTIILWTVTCIVIASTAIRTIYLTIINNKWNLSFWAIVITTLQFYPFHYTFWSIFNYLNEGSIRMIHTQLFYGITDLLVGAISINCIDTKLEPHPFCLYVIVLFSAVHILSNLSLLGSNETPRFGLLVMWYSDIVTFIISIVLVYRLAIFKTVCLRIDSFWKYPKEVLDYLDEKKRQVKEQQQELEEVFRKDIDYIEKDKEKEVEISIRKRLSYIFTLEHFWINCLVCLGFVFILVYLVRNACLWSPQEC